MSCLLHRYVHLAFPHSKEKGMVKPCNLIICGPGEGQTDQYASAVHDAIRMLLSACQPLQQKQQKKPCFPKSSSCLLTDHQTGDAAVLEPGCVIPAGGTFEFLLVCALQQHGRKQSGDSDMDVSVVSKLLLDALLTVPRQIYGHSQRQFLQTQDRILNFIQTHLHPFSLVSVGDLHCCGATGTSSNIFREELGLESVSCKYQLLLAVAQCASHLLQVDTVLHTHIILRTKSHQLANNSLEGKEDEADTWQKLRSKLETCFLTHFAEQFSSEIQAPLLRHFRDCYTFRNFISWKSNICSICTTLSKTKPLPNLMLILSLC